MMTLHSLVAAAAALVATLGLRADLPTPVTQPARSNALTTWKQGGSAFGIFVPSERPMNATDANGNRLPPLYTEGGAHTLGSNPLLDYLFLNLEGAYDAASVKAMPWIRMPWAAASAARSSRSQAVRSASCALSPVSTMPSVMNTTTFRASARPLVFSS